MFKVPIVTFIGNAFERELKKKELKTTKEILGTNIYPVILTNYEIPLRETVLQQTKWRFIFVDEGHRLKNPNSALNRFVFFEYIYIFNHFCKCTSNNYFLLRFDFIMFQIF